jgi:hypothetical protein
MIQVPDTIVHGIRIVVDQGNFFRGIELRQRAHPGSYKKPQILMFLSANVCIQKCGVRRVINSRQKVSVDIVHGLAM